MKFICDRNVLSNAVTGVSKAVTQRSSVPVLEGILCKAEGFALTLTGYDLEMGITTTVEANVRSRAKPVLPAKLLGDMVRRLSSDEVEITCLDTGVATVKGGITEFDIMTLNPGDFPALPNPGADRRWILTRQICRKWWKPRCTPSLPTIKAGAYGRAVRH